MRVLIFFISLVSLVLFSCSSNPKDKLTGKKWHYGHVNVNEDSFSIQFSKDGSFVSTTTMDPRRQTFTTVGTWMVSDDAKSLILKKDNEADSAEILELNSNKLSITNKPPVNYKKEDAGYTFFKKDTVTYTAD